MSVLLPFTAFFQLSIANCGAFVKPGPLFSDECRLCIPVFILKK